MSKKLLKLIRRSQKQKKTERQLLKEKVEKGTDLVIREYRDVFVKLADYDRT